MEFQTLKIKTVKVPSIFVNYYVMCTQFNFNACTLYTYANVTNYFSKTRSNCGFQLDSMLAHNNQKLLNIQGKILMVLRFSGQKQTY